MTNRIAPGLALTLLVVGCRTTPPTPTTVGVAPPAPVLNVDPAFEQTGWLVGTWVNERLDTEETWTPPAGGTMFGVNRTVSEGTEVFFEHLRIVRDLRGRLTYFAQPRGREPATPFALVDEEEGQLVFENPEHDFPQRIIYQRTGPESMLMHIEGESDGVPKRTSWRMVRGVIPVD